MRPLVFHHTTRGALHRYAHVPGSDVVVEESNWAVLCGDWPDDDRTPYMRHAVNNNNTEEVAVYLGLIWRLTQGRARHAIPCYYRDDATRILGEGCLFVAWEYEVDAEDVDSNSRDRGFIPARSAVPIRPEPTAFEWEHRAQAGLFRVDTYDDLVGVTRATLGDASAEISVFATAGGLRDDLVDALRAPRAPDLEDLLSEGDLFADLTIGVDIGNYDSLIIYSRDDITEQLAQLAQEYETAIDAYEARVPTVTTVESMLGELDRLARAQ
ncbi:hypothetical protein DSM112329_02837 [Paraconexibacter sp. AEG42_29]|uniref:Uncharacterized protein n=1 Tax=Paraconexibacter sp. AEG42_29 TaxID=2997339 RepID=A0AAU7AWK3_9ACTN